MAAVAFLAEGASLGTITVIPGNERASATSSIPICDGPSSPIEMPACEPTSFTFMAGKATDIRICSYALHMRKQAKLATTGVLPLAASPPATLDQVALGDADLESPIRKSVGEDLGARRVADVPVDRHDFRMRGAQLLQRLTERVARRLTQFQTALFTDRHLDPRLGQ